MAYQLSITEDNKGDPLAETEEEMRLIKSNGLRYLILAADNGHIEAQFELGKHYINAIILPLDISKGFQYITLSAKNGNTDAMVYLAIAYREGSTVKKNNEQSIYWFKALLEINPNETRVMVELAKTYWSENKLIDAAKYFAMAGELGSKFASILAVKAYTLLGEIFKYEDFDYAFENYQNALRWNYEILNDDSDDTYKNECIENLPQIQLGLGTILFFKEDKGDARPYLERSSRAGLKFADVLLAEMEIVEMIAQGQPLYALSNPFNRMYNAIYNGNAVFSPDEICLFNCFFAEKLLFGYGAERNDNTAYQYYSIAASQNSRFSDMAKRELQKFRLNAYGSYEYIHNQG